MLQPKKQKFRKQFRGNMKGVASANNTVAHGDFGLKAIDRGWIDARQIEAARRAMTGHIKRRGKIWVNIFPDKPFTKKPTNSKMLGGKGDVEGYVAVVKPGTVMFEIGGVKSEIAREALRLALHKISIKAKIVSKDAI
ncbi:50S ribosomal protein L16 [Candidatus Dojkabacteria bacterium]|nr:50S ribosomal protein L16 [Candidatus Dojkabacteria bacterium]